MNQFRIVGFCLIGILAGCSSMQRIGLADVEETNWVQVTLHSGETMTGSVIEAEPYRLVIRTAKGEESVINTNEVGSIQRKAPVYDERRRGISEAEISENQTGRNAVIYGLGGGMLSFGASFFAGSMMAQAAEDGGALAATTAVGGGVGTLFFIKAGKALDRKQAIERIREERRSRPIRVEQNEGPSLNDLRKRMNDEKKQQEELRREREELLRRLEDKNRVDE